MELSFVFILFCLIAAAQGIHDVQRRDAASESQRSVTLQDIPKNDLKDLKLDNENFSGYDQLKQMKNIYDELKSLEDRFDELAANYSKLQQKTKACQASDRDCADLFKNGVKMDGVYNITPDNSPSAFKVYCDMTTDGGGWTLFQKRVNGSEDFYLDWQSYKDGFGNLNGEHWLGNERIYTITKQRRYELRVDMEDADGNRRYAIYDNFAIASEAQKYKLVLGNYSGNAGDSLGVHRGYAFTTKDRDNDSHGGNANCAKLYKGAWWYYNCHLSNLNGLYHLTNYGNGVIWYTFKGHQRSLKTTEMKIRPVGFKCALLCCG
ncbi:fibrinogen C domain-containing protein 1 [Lingula anatina]|uniref:Fibrinogen C domain-containing protein 1 n=1 Tax=Lingula anatina TaxID=7574 RepID=A0A1S3JQQ0_LINAN|nr:fibrinogen C domain-containing protein 1 [Lingula anatina]|eukprot:XP_013412718.1 fibrinogen C domain-containing protein 1 [Lingula anatina]